MDFVPFEEGIEVNGRTVWAVVDGFQSFKLLASRYLLAEGLGQAAPDGSVVLEPDGWYSQAAWLRAFRNVTEMSPTLLFRIGQSIPANAEFPPWVQDIHDGIRSIDIAYHMNHRRHGMVMFDPASGTMTEGIGHYGYQPDGPRRIRSVCQNPYPCKFDQGIVTAMARRFEPQAQVAHEPGSCRSKGGEACGYVITW